MTPKQLGEVLVAIKGNWAIAADAFDRYPAQNPRDVQVCETIRTTTLMLHGLVEHLKELAERIPPEYEFKNPSKPVPYYDVDATPEQGAIMSQQAPATEEHVAACRAEKWVVYNPKQLPEVALPVIYGFNNGGDSRFLMAFALAEDGTVLGNHCCSEEWYMCQDLGVIEGCRMDRHKERYQIHYPEGYRMEFVRYADVPNNAALKSAITKGKGRDS